ncbi:MAG: cation transporter [Lachnospiraceae bacterium]|nr:cation transporter [Lachnospiraceae bacterium]
MHASKSQQRSEKAALNISLWSSALFVAVELVMAVITSSQAVLLDAVYDSVELVMILVSLTLIPLLYRPSNENRPFGYLQVESLFVVVKGAIMVSVTVGLIVNNIEIMLHGGRKINFTQIAYFELFACVISLLVIFWLHRLNRSLNSPIVTMEIQEWKIDAVASIGMAAAFFLPQLIQASWFEVLRPYLDQGITVVLSIFMLPTPIKAIVTGLRDLFLLPPEQETVERIRDIVTPILEQRGYDQLYFDIVRTGRKLWISVYITFNKDDISLVRFRKLQTLVIEELKKEYQDFYLELLPDIQYTGDTEV